MRILVIGGDGYLGWPTSMYFARRGHDVAILDSGVKRRWEEELGARPLVPVPALSERAAAWRRAGGRPIRVQQGDVRDGAVLRRLLAEFAPEAVIHYGEQPSAPFSMIDAAHAVLTQANNVLGTLELAFALRDVAPQAHLIKLGTMGEYGTPNIDIEEGYLEVTHNGRTDRLPFPKSPGSFYHLSKVHDSHNLMLAARLWSLRVTDLNQGVVYGLATDETALGPELHTSFHYDAWFGTVINRFVVQAAAGLPLTVYGRGGQKRAFLNIRDTLRCVELAALHPAKPGEFRVFNQFTETFTVAELAERVVAAGRLLGLRVRRQELPNPRAEDEDHYYRPRNDGLLALGLQPHLLSDDVLAGMLEQVLHHRDRIDERLVPPTVAWRPAPARAAAGWA
jgi:UDP-sulfoquinovose synthase